jgi:hypothetical protein
MIRCSFLFVLVGIFLTAPLGAQISDRGRVETGSPSGSSR